MTVLSASRRLVLLSKYCINGGAPSTSMLRCELGAPRSHINTSTAPKKIDLWEVYQRTKARTKASPLPKDRNPTAIYANNELDLDSIDVYGFDYDYTLACYRDSLHNLIYNLGRETLVRDHKYPKEIAHLGYNPQFAVRGLHCDVQKGFLLKIDAFHNIQMGTVYRGLHSVDNKEVMESYYGSHIPFDYMSSYHGKGPKMYQLMDLFALPEMNLYANVIEYFINHDIPYDPEYIFYDVKNAVQGLHVSGVLHNGIMENFDTYIGLQSEVAEMLQRLKAADKKIFLITNSGVSFVNKGMTYMVGPDWADLFDVVITNARKPKFFIEATRIFRSYNPRVGLKSWTKVDSFEKGQFYQEGNYYKLSQITGWNGAQVLYFGDHVYTDLADVSIKHGWRTGAIIPELEQEIQTLNTDFYKQSICWLSQLENLINKMQIYDDPESQEIRHEWMKEKNHLRQVTKDLFNPRFGSLFRTYHNPTYFTRRLNRFADIYTSSITNLSNYSLKHTFYPRRSPLPHELKEIHY